MYTFYISPEDYKTAEQNGISPGTLEQRIRGLAWDMKTATTKPPRQQIPILKEWRERAEKNGICYETLRKRINKWEWEVERAITQPLIDRRKNLSEIAKGRRKYPIETLEKAEKNGIAYATFRQRLYNGWSIEDASTIPVMSRTDITHIIKNEYGIATRKKRPQYVKGGAHEQTSRSKGEVSNATTIR